MAKRTHIDEVLEKLRGLPEPRSDTADLARTVLREDRKAKRLHEELTREVRSYASRYLTRRLGKKVLEISANAKWHTHRKYDRIKGAGEYESYTEPIIEIVICLRRIREKETWGSATLYASFSPRRHTDLREWLRKWSDWIETAPSDLPI